MNGTRVVYVISSDWQFWVYISIHSLLASGSDVDQITVLIVGGGGTRLKRLTGPIEVRDVEPLDDDYFLINKTRIAALDADRLVFLDADTVVLRPLETLWEGRSADVIARIATSYERPDFPEQLWHRALSLVEAPPTPYFNTGVLVLQNGAQRKLRGVWQAACRTLRERYEPKRSYPGLGRRFAEQTSFSAAASRLELSHAGMDGNTEHATGWTFPVQEVDPDNPPVIYHANGPFVSQAARLEQRGAVDFSRPIASGRAHPYFWRLQYRRHLRWGKEKVKEMVPGLGGS